MNRSLKLSMLLGLALGSSQAVALELGQIHVKSALGQPLLAEIPVTPEGPADLRSLSARLAPSEDFDRAGITDGRPSVPLTFAVVTAPGGGKVIRITSADAISAPYLDLLVEVDNAAGKSVREYTILLDPPGMQASPAVAAPSAPVASRPSHAVTKPAAAAAPAQHAAPAPSMPVEGGKLGPVRPGQTLSAIAQQNLPGGVDLNQMMLALQQANPHAFFRDNVNALKSGAVLRVPSASEAKATSIAAAMAEVRRQNSDWRAGTTTAPTNVADAGTRANASSSPSTRAGKADDHLALVPSKSAGKTAKSGAGGNGKAAAAAQQDLLRSQESLAAMQQQGAELKSRLKALEDINDKNERLLSLKDSEIAELQRKLAAARKSASAAVAPIAKASSAAPVAIAAPAAAASAMTQPVAAAAAAASVAPASKAMTISAEPAASTSTAPAAAMADHPMAAKPKPKPVAAKHTPTKPAAPVPSDEQPWYMQTWAMAAGAGAVVLVGLLVLLGRRGKSGAKPAGSSLADKFGSESPEALEGEDLDQEELLDQLAEHPDDIGLHLELVSLYFHRRDVEHFEAAAEAMYAHISDPQQSEWQDVAAMGEDLVPGHPLFVGVDTSVPENERGALHGFDLDGYAAADAPAESGVEDAGHASAPGGPSKISEYNFDFDLTPRSPASAPAEHGEEFESAPESESGFVSDSEIAAVAASDEEPAHVADASAWQASPDAGDYEPAEFSDDPIDTKLDLARAYLDMGDADGARAMLEEVLSEGGQSQQETARRLLDNIA